MAKKTSILILLFFGFTFSYSQNVKKTTPVKSIKVDTLNKVNIINKIDTSNKDKQKSLTNKTLDKTTYFTEWEKGFISGLIATLIGFILTMMWDIYKNRRDKIEKDQIIEKLIKDTLNENLGYISNINSILKQELDVLNQSQIIPTNITTLKNDFWDLIKFNIPKNLLTYDNLLQKLQDISSLTKSINEYINSREMYRLNNGAMDNYTEILRHYDELILAENKKLFDKIKIFKTDYK